MLNPVDNNAARRPSLTELCSITRLSSGEPCIGRRIQLNFLWAGAGRLLSVVFLFLLHTLLARQLPAADYGRYILLESVTLVTSLLILAGLPAVSLRLIRSNLATGNDSAVNDTVKTSLGIMGGTSLLTAFGLFAVAFSTRDHVFGGVLWQYLGWILIWATCAALLRMVSELARGCQMLGFSYLVGGQSGGFGVNGILLCSVLAVGVIYGLSFGIVLWIQIAIQFLCVTGALTLIVRATSTPRSLEPFGQKKLRVRQFLQSSVPLLIQQLVAFGLPEADTMLLGSHSSAEEIAIYGSAKKLVFLGAVPLLLVNHAVQPFIVDFYSKRDSRQLTTLVRGTATFAGIPSFFVLLLMFSFPEFILGTLFGEGYSLAATPLRVLCVGAAGFVLTGSCGLVLVMTGHERTAMWSSVAIGLAYLIAAPLLILRYGIYGAAISAAGLQICSNLSAMLLVFYHERIWTGITFSRTIAGHCLKLIFSKEKNQ